MNYTEFQETLKKAIEEGNQAARENQERLRVERDQKDAENEKRNLEQQSVAERWAETTLPSLLKNTLSEQSKPLYGEITLENVSDEVIGKLSAYNVEKAFKAKGLDVTYKYDHATSMNVYTITVKHK